MCSAAKADLVRSLGASDVLDYRTDDPADGRQQWDVVLDIGGNPSIRRLRRMLTPTGTAVLVGGEEGGRVDRRHRPLAARGGPVAVPAPAPRDADLPRGRPRPRAPRAVPGVRRGGAGRRRDVPPGRGRDRDAPPRAPARCAARWRSPSRERLARWVRRTMPTAPDGLAVHTLDFDGLAIAWDSRVLEPRPWTATQSRWAAELAAVLPPGPVLELCCGAGQIGLLTVDALRAQARGRRPQPRRLRADPAPTPSPPGSATGSRCARATWPRCWPRDERFPLVVADPPWVPRAEVGRYPEDPVLAIDGGAGRPRRRTALPRASPSGTWRPAARWCSSSAPPSRPPGWRRTEPRLAVREVRTAERGVLVRLTAAG